MQRGLLTSHQYAIHLSRASKTLNDAELCAEEEELEDEREERVGEDQGHGVGDLRERICEMKEIAF